MTRLIFRQGEQGRYLNEVRNVLKANSDDLARIVGISGRSFRYWMNEKTLGDRKGLEKLSIVSGVSFPEIVEEREEWWSGRINGRRGALVRLEMYGPPGNILGRRKGGIVSQQRRRENPEYYRTLGCIVPRAFIVPEKSRLLAEFLGIVLGDGGLTKYQLTITLNSIKDHEYMKYVIKLSNKLFKYSPYVFKNKGVNANSLKFSGINFVNLLISNGIAFGNKSIIQIEVPGWIKNSLVFSTWCLRGLMDTDGGLFVHKYTVNGKQYSYLKINFTNVSKPLLKFVFDTLMELGFTPKYQSYNKVWLYRKDEVRRYFEIVGSSNYRLISRLR